MSAFVPVEHHPFGDGEIECVFPTTSVQREILLGAWLGGEDANRAFNECIALRLTGVWHQAAFEAAYRKLVQLHDVLRTKLSADGEWGLVFRTGPERLTHVDLTGLPVDRQESALDALRVNEVTTGFNLEVGPLHRATLVSLHKQLHWLLFSAHHVICDWWTTGVLVRNLGALYRQEVRGESQALEAQRYALYANDEKQREDGEDGRVDLEFWRQALAGYKQDWALPADYPRDHARSYVSRRVDVEWSHDASSALRTLAKQHSCTLTVALLSVLQLWLFLEVAACDVVLGVPSAGQAMFAGKGLAGHCVHLLPVRLKCEPSATIGSLISHCRATVLECLEHRGLTYSRLLEYSVQRRQGLPPLVQLTANVDMGLPALDFDALQVEYATIPRRFDAFELSLNAVTWTPRLTFQAQFNTKHFTEGSVRQWIESWGRLAMIARQYPGIELARLANDAGPDSVARL